ncbi:MAG: hypothetical protein DYG98_04145 [Haliscomenobacteraceae bacterium CHB4]|nr:hypothetical protein [Haliscomenobacteraceae bacterium CHB4]
MYHFRICGSIPYRQRISCTSHCPATAARCAAQYMTGPAICCWSSREKGKI